MARDCPRLRKRLLEEKLGLNRGGIITSGFDQETINIVSDIVNKKYDSLRDHPKIINDEAPWPDWTFFLVIHNTHASIWAIEDKHLATVEVIDQDYLTPYDVSKCIEPTSIVHRFHVVKRNDERYYVETEKIDFRAKKPEFDVCLYVGAITLSLQGIKVFMAMIASENDRLLQSDSLNYCKDFVMRYFNYMEKEFSPEHAQALEYLTFRKKELSEASKRSRKQNTTSGWSQRSFPTSTIAGVSIGTVLGMLGGLTLTLYLLHKST